METPIGFSVNGNIYCYYAQTLDMLVRVWEAPVDMAGDPGSSRLCTAYGFSVDRGFHAGDGKQPPLYLHRKRQADVRL
ncbi:MAG: hypothetical protein ACLU3I_11510 [Acutalibacteraceae bacterium]